MLGSCSVSDAFGGEDAGGVFGVVAAAGGALGDFGAGGDERLAHLGGHGAASSSMSASSSAARRRIQKMRWSRVSLG